MLDMSAILGFLNSDCDHSSPDGTAGPSGSFSICASPSYTSNCWKPPGENNSLSLDILISSPLEALDTVRHNERSDFQTNGIAMELDAFDLYQARLRATPIPCSVNKMSTDVPVGALENKRCKRKAKPTKNTVCVFCKNNGETLSVYGTHVLKDASGRVTCPILRRYTCPICGAVGDNAHTIKYCPNNANPISCVAMLRTPRSSNGRTRFS